MIINKVTENQFMALVAHAIQGFTSNPAHSDTGNFLLASWAIALAREVVAQLESQEC